MLVHVFCPLLCPRICRHLDRNLELEGQQRDREGSFDEADATRMLYRPPEPTRTTGLLQVASGSHNNRGELSAPCASSTELPDTGVRSLRTLVPKLVNHKLVLITVMYKSKILNEFCRPHATTKKTQEGS